MDETQQFKWLKIYNSIIRLKYCGFLIEEPPYVKELNHNYQKFLDDNNLNPKNEEVKFFGFDFLFGLSYLTLVRISEFIENELNPDFKKEVFELANWKDSRIKSFNDLLELYEINLKTLKKSGNKTGFNDDKEKLRFFISSLRHSISHFNYSDHENSLEFKNKNKRTNELELQCEIDRKEFLNFCIHFSLAVNDFIFVKFWPK